MNDFAKKFSQLEFDIVNKQHRLSVCSCLKAYYGITYEKKYRISFVSTKKPYELESTNELKITQGKESNNVYWTCFDLINDEAKDVFFIFCDSLIEVIENKEDEYSALLALKDRYFSWKLLLKNKGKMSYEAYQGLFGELYFLSECLGKNNNIDQVINSWVGPEGYSKDFSLNNSWYEVKTIGTNSTSLHISSLTQLDSDVSGHLVTIVVERMSNEFNDGLCSVPIVYRNILDKINSHQIREGFGNKVLKYGFVDDDDTINNYKFEVKKVSSYIVDEKFPKITKKTMKINAISQVSYDLLISAIGEYMEDNL